MKVEIGIDPGVETGYALANDGHIVLVGSGSAVAVESFILKRQLINDPVLYIEDARKRKWFGDRAEQQRQGAGSVKRDSQRWEEFAKFHGIKYHLIAPAHNKTKTKASWFERVTGYSARTNQHGRDAAMLIHGRR